MGCVEVMTQKGGPTGRGKGRERSKKSEKAGGTGDIEQIEKPRTYSPSLHLRNTEREPIILSRVGFLGRYYISKEEEKKLKSVQTIISTHDQPQLGRNRRGYECAVLGRHKGVIQHKRSQI